MPQILTFTSDFGADSHYISQMKAAALRLAPEVTIVDITHSIPPQGIGPGAVVRRSGCSRIRSTARAGSCSTSGRRGA